MLRIGKTQIYLTGGTCRAQIPKLWAWTKVRALFYRMPGRGQSIFRLESTEAEIAKSAILQSQSETI